MESRESEWARDIPPKEQAQIVSRILAFTRPYRKSFSVAIFLAFFLSVINILLPRILQNYLDNYLSPMKATTQITFVFAGLYLFGIFVKCLVQFLYWYVFPNASLKTYQSIRLALFEKLHTLGMRYFDQTPAGSIVSRVTNDTEKIFEFLWFFLMLISGIFAVITSFIGMYQINHQIAVTCLLFLPILLVIIYFYQKYSTKVYGSMRERLSELNTKLNESISGMSIVQQFRQEKRLENEFKATNDEYYRTRIAVVKTNSLLLSPIINMFYALCVVLVLTMFGFDAMSHKVEVGMIYAFITYVQSFFNPMTEIMDTMSLYQEGLVAGSRILKIMDNEEYTPQQELNAQGEITLGKVEFRNVSFSYDGKTNVLKNISFIAEPGETIALVGHTGSGKSSIINVLMRFYEFHHGEVLLDDKNIKEYPIEELRQKMGLVLQDAFLFYGDIASNIRLFNKTITDKEVEKAAEFVQADGFIKQLPDGYHSKVIERGASYSSGQKQLISFARTIVTNPKILILDEATANIDSETEALIQEGLKRMRKGRTTIAIAHRLSTIKDANTILVLDKGEIVEVGTHEELIEFEGRYYDMYQLQKSGQ